MVCGDGNGRSFLATSGETRIEAVSRPKEDIPATTERGGNADERTDREVFGPRENLADSTLADTESLRKVLVSEAESREPMIDRLPDLPAEEFLFVGVDPGLLQCCHSSPF